MEDDHYIIGIDEAGRGPLAGPIVVGGVLALSQGALCDLEGIRDSKKLSPKRRNEWYIKLTAHPGFLCASASIQPAVIDTINISRAGDRGAHRVYKRLIKLHSANVAFPGVTIVIYNVLLDAGLRIPKEIPQQAFIKGDERIPLIAAASIVAKVTRDRIMCRLHRKYPAYGFDVHKGYGTLHHRQMIAKMGFSSVHRRSFRTTIL